MDKCVEIGRFYGDCSIFADGISMIFPLLMISFLIILFLKLKGELKICNVPLTSVKNFDICELKHTAQPMNNNQTIEMNRLESNIWMIKYCAELSVKKNVVP